MSERNVTRCSGEGQGSCMLCSSRGIWNRSWMCFLYQVDGYDGIYCSNCVKELLNNDSTEEEHE